MAGEGLFVVCGRSLKLVLRRQCFMVGHVGGLFRGKEARLVVFVAIKFLYMSLMPFPFREKGFSSLLEGGVGSGPLMGPGEVLIEKGRSKGQGVLRPVSEDT